MIIREEADIEKALDLPAGFLEMAVDDELLSEDDGFMFFDIFEEDVRECAYILLKNKDCTDLDTQASIIARAGNVYGWKG